MEKIWNDAHHKNVACYVVYLDSSNALFFDAEHTEAVPADRVFELFAHGLVGVKEDVYYTPATCKVDGTITFNGLTEGE